MNVRGGPIFWAIVILLVYLAAKAPGTLSALLNAIGHALVVFAHGVAAFLDSVLRRSS
jgi:hypothetical protein